MKNTFRRRTLWIVSNLVGMAVYLKLASALWPPAAEQTLPGGPGDAFYWILFVVPILAVFMGVNSVALFVVVRRPKASAGRGALAFWCTVAVSWIGVFFIERHLARTFIDVQYL